MIRIFTDMKWVDFTIYEESNLKKKERRRLNKKPVDILDDQNIDKNKVGK